ncbi:hypothetical protein HC928_00220 [bacterium]|nr:hypothetical protein [bacterium]
MHNYRAHSLANEWTLFKKNNKSTKMVLIDILANQTTQAKSAPDVLNVGGFSDQVFEVVNEFVTGNGTPTFWTDKINKVAL